MLRTFLIISLLTPVLMSHAQNRSVTADITIHATTSKVWDVITNAEFAKVLGAEFDKGAFVESDWKLGSDVHFKYEPDRLISTGKITKLIEGKLINVGYDFGGFKYNEKYSIKQAGGSSVLGIDAGPYTSDYEAQVKVWNSWLAKVKELSEAN